MTSNEFLTGVVNEHMNGEILPNAKVLTIRYTHKQDDPVQVEKDLEQFMTTLEAYCLAHDIGMKTREEHQIVKNCKGECFVRMVLFDCDYINWLALTNLVWQKGPVYVDSLIRKLQKTYVPGEVM